MDGIALKATLTLNEFTKDINTSKQQQYYLSFKSPQALTKNKKVLLLPIICKCLSPHSFVITKSKIDSATCNDNLVYLFKIFF